MQNNNNMRKLLILCLLLFSLSAAAQRIEYKRVDSLQYLFWVSNVDSITKYEWTFEAPPDYYTQLVVAKQDTTYYHFREAGFVSIYVKYRNKSGKWSDDLYEHFNVK